MSMILLLVLVVGMVLAFAGGLWLLIVAFRQSILWGLAYMFVPFAALVFIIVHWQEAKKPFLVLLLGLALMVGPVIKMGPPGDAETTTAGSSSTISGRSMPAGVRPRSTPTGSGFAPSTPHGTSVAPLATGAVTPATTPDTTLTELPRPTPPPGILPPPPPPETPTHNLVKPADLGRHLGEVLRFRMKDGRMVVGTLRSVDAENVRIERNLGLGTTSFTLPLADIEDALERR
jgi:hypothetical protein